MESNLYNRLSVAVSFGCISADDFINVIEKYKLFLHDLYFSPVEDISFQTRRLNYDFLNTSIEDRHQELSKVIDYAKSNNINLTLTLNSPNMSLKGAVEIFEIYHKKYNIQNVTTFCKVAKILNKTHNNLNLICSYNEGITGIERLEYILGLKLFNTIVFGSSMLHNLTAFRLAKKYGVTTSIIANTGCMLDCHLFCKYPNLCKSQFDRHLNAEGIDHLYATTSLFPEEIYNFFLHDGSIDYVKLASRPIDKDELNKLLNTYIYGNTYNYIQESINNYHLYARLSHFIPYYSNINLDNVLIEKQRMWEKYI